jgi:hypothetical protein
MLELNASSFGRNRMILYNASKKIEWLILAGVKKVIAPKTVKDTIYGTLFSLAIVFCLLFLWENITN